MRIPTHNSSLNLQHMHAQARPHDAVSICLVIVIVMSRPEIVRAPQLSLIAIVKQNRVFLFYDI